ncbi:MAG TPA: hypothetical protein VJN43_02310 [Bryobacteraceae bacterium]|nr:hypothetical protein [Bryobacteraceae bacterium]
MNSADSPAPLRSLSFLRIGAGIAVLVALAAMAVALAPVYVHSMELERFLHEQPAGASDESIRAAITTQGRALGLGIVPDHLQIKRLPEGVTEVRYVVRVTLPLYTVDLHFTSNLQGDSARR